ncbi:ferritin-like domain-containing protein [Isoptericola sp. 4D.3]|uniref:Ferritin-like domain-containing protein n=1 Tax=Isoptericola peretonis TaxID=2918523 RepID=A0ABT0J838_9MICO|nr:ferritin-like domain-containing protein [Isoptericola sp. 4D.3]
MEPHPAPAAVLAVAEPASRRRRRAAAAGAVLAAGLLAGCGVRLEAPPAAEPVPDALEVVRRTAVSDALLVADGAEAALEEVPVERERLVDELTRIVAASREQAEALGGEYDSGLATDEPTSSQSSASGRVSPPEVVQALDDAAARSRTAAGTTSDGPLARLLASIGAAQTVSGERLARLVDVDGPDMAAPRVPLPAGTDGGTGGGSPSPSGSAGDDGDAGDDGEGEDDERVPEGLTARDLSTLVVSEDATRYALQLRAAIGKGDERARLLDRVAQHAQRADGWAAVAGTQGTEQDPRRPAYEVPRVGELDDEALVLDLEDDLATDYATLVGTTAAGTRGVLVDLLVDAALTLDDWGAEPEPFPGLPEQGEEGSGDS